MNTFKKLFPATVAGIIIGVILGAVTISEASPRSVTLNAGDGVTCSGAMISDTRMNLQCDIAVQTPLPTTTPPTTNPSPPSPTYTTTPTSPATTTPPPSPSPSPSPSPGSFPGAGNTGIPPFSPLLTTYTGPCTITTANTFIDLKVIGCSTLNIQAKGVVITRSRLKAISDGSGYNANAQFSVTDSEITCGIDETCVGESNFTLLRINAYGGNRIAHCFRSCSATDSWFHGIRYSAGGHASAFRLGQQTTLTHDTLSCDAPNDGVGGGCSADVTGYPDFEPINHNTMQNCYLTAPAGAYFHAYGGATATKQFSNDPTNATYVVFINNTFQHGWFNGSPVTDFAAGRVGNKFSGNVWLNGDPVTL